MDNGKLRIGKSGAERFLEGEITLARCPVCQMHYPADEEHKCFKISTKSDISKMVPLKLTHSQIIGESEFVGCADEIYRSFVAQCVDMSDKAILEAIVATAKAEGVTDLFLLDKAFVMNALKKALNEENYRKQSEWISVDNVERLPKDREWVLVWHTGYATPKKAQYKDDCGAYLPIFILDGDNGLEGEVTHWMPLPEGPKNEKGR